MDIGSILLILALALAVVLFVSQPFLKQPVKEGVAPKSALATNERTRSALLAERDRVLDALQELDFDQALGKIPGEDFSLQRGSLTARGAEVLRELDRLGAHAEPRPAGDRLEADISARRGAGEAGMGVGDSIEDQIAARRRAREEKSVGFCPKCGRPLQKSDRFCPKCGTAL